MNANPETQANPSLSERLRDVQVGVRSELEVSRHLFHGKPTYIIRDPITFQTHHLSASDYEVLVQLDKTRPLGEIFEQLVAAGTIAATDEEAFYNFIVKLHRLAFLNLPISDDKAIYRRFEARQAAKKWELLLGFLFLRVPLFNPDALLEKTIGRMRFLFSRPFFTGWAMLMALSVFVASTRWQELIEPLNGILASQNLFLFWALFVALKVIHEFGHAYACKYFGGHVPEMGVYMIAFTPCAYVDASAAWGFSRKRDRLIVSLAGMYTESIIAAAALMVWTMTGPSLINSLAYQTFFLASIVTVGFNINPLMRYDGYYIASDLLELPNLRSRAEKHVRATLKRLALGIAPQGPGESRSVGATLLVYGVAAAIYRVFIVLAICGLIASKMFIIGTFLAAAYAGKIIYKMIRDSVHYLWLAQETAAVRVRARAVSVLMIVCLPIVVAVVPLPVKVTAAGVVTTETEHIVRAETDGFVDTVPVEPGQRVSANDVLVELHNPEHASRLAEAQAQVEAASLRLLTYQRTDQAKTSQETNMLRYHQQEMNFRKSQSMNLSIRANRDGFVARCLRPRDAHRFIRTGEPIATICAGNWVVRALVTADELSDIAPQIGQPVHCRVTSNPSELLAGIITMVSPAGSRHVAIPSLTHLAGGQIPVNPASNDANQPYFEITIALNSTGQPPAYPGTTVHARFDAPMQPIGIRLYRSLLRFKTMLSTG